MGIKRKYTATGPDLPLGILRGTGIGILVTLAGAGVMSWLIVREYLQEMRVGYCAMGILLLASFAAAWASGREKILPASLATGAAYYGLLLGANALFLDGSYTGLGVTALLVLAGAGSAVLLKLRAERPRKVRIGGKRHR